MQYRIMSACRWTMFWIDPNPEYLAILQELNTEYMVVGLQEHYGYQVLELYMHFCEPHTRSQVLEAIPELSDIRVAEGGAISNYSRIYDASYVLYVSGDAYTPL